MQARGHITTAGALTLTEISMVLITICIIPGAPKSAARGGCNVLGHRSCWVRHEPSCDKRCFYRPKQTPLVQLDRLIRSTFHHHAIHKQLSAADPSRIVDGRHCPPQATQKASRSSPSSARRLTINRCTVTALNRLAVCPEYPLHHPNSAPSPPT